MREAVSLRKIVVLILFAVFSLALAQNGVGAKYGARDPRICTDVKNPKSGAIDADQATKYVICNQEGVLSDQLYLIENVKVTVGGSRPYNSFSDSYATSIDTTAPVYPIHGSFDRYQCDKVSTVMENTGKNCNFYRYSKAEGKCFKTTFGDWYCNMQDLSNPNAQTALPPPGGATITSAQQKPAAIKNPVPQTAVKAAATGVGKAQDGFPKPDFSAMEKYFSISGIKYDAISGALYFVGKMAKKNNAVDWVINFYDSDGIKLIDANGISIVNGDHYDIGDIAKYSFYLPPQALQKRISRVVITKKVY